MADKQRNLASLAALHDEAVDVYYATRGGAYEPVDGLRLVNMLRSIAEIHQAGELEGRVADLQRRLKARERADA